MALDRSEVVRRADDLARQGQLAAAIEEYRRLVDEQPGDLSAGNALGDLYARHGQPDKAIEQFTRLAESERAQGFTTKAVALYKKALKVDPGAECALVPLADIALTQELFADATVHLNRLAQRQRERDDHAGVAGTLVRLASLPSAKADVKLVAARSSDGHAAAGEVARLFANAARALAGESRAAEALDAWLDAAGRTEDLVIRRSAALASVEAGAPDRARLFLTIDVAGEHPELLWVLGESAVGTGDERVARAALGRYRELRPSESDRVTELLAIWASPVDSSAAPSLVVMAHEEVPLAMDVDDIDADTGTETGTDGPGAAAGERLPMEEIDLTAAFDELDGAGSGEAVVTESSAAPVNAAPEDAAGDDSSLLAQLEAAAETPALRFQAAARLGRVHAGRGEWARAADWLERAAASTAPLRDHGLEVRYDLADALERLGLYERAVAVWADLEFEAGAYRDVSTRLERATRHAGSAPL
jgi:tetratricopeptide (TPR) repeat protein